MSRSMALILALATGAAALRPQCRTSLAPRRDFLGAAAAAGGGARDGAGGQRRGRGADGRRRGRRGAGTGARTSGPLA